MNIFPYSWHINDEEIHVYGFLENGETCLLHIEGFTPYLYIKLPIDIDWNVGNVSKLVQYIKRRNHIHTSAIMYKRPLYFAHVDVSDNNIRYNTHPYLFVAFKNTKDRKIFGYNYNKKNHSISGIGEIEFEIYEDNATPILQLTCIRDISTSDWFSIRNVKEPNDRIYRYKNEFAVYWKNLNPLTTPLNIVPQPLIMSWDIECCFNDPNKFSDGSNDNDIVFQISCVFGRQGESKENWKKYLLTLGNPSQEILTDITVKRYKSEFHLLRGFCDLVIEINPQVMIGYNIFKFDIPFMYKRAQRQFIIDDFVRHGCTFKKSNLETIKWSSSAYSNQEMNFLDLDGRITIDLLTLVQRDYNLESYKLDNVAEKFIGSKKDPLDHLDIFMCYKKGMKESLNGVSKSLSVVGKYCVKDSLLVLELFEKFQYWYSLVEMAKICQVPVSHLFLYGQQLKVFSQVYKYCYNNHIVVESGRYKPSENDFCSGAYVFTPKPGLYDNVVSFDFQSLYPSIIVSHNIDFTTLVTDPKIPDDLCHIIEWEEHINCPCSVSTISKDTKDVRCTSYRFRWLKSPPGVLPVIVQNLLNARKNVRNQMKNMDDKSLLWGVFNKRQLAYKVSSNSMYGILPTKQGYLPFLPGGMCITAVGRHSVEKVSQIIKNDYGGDIIYGDTDSNYVHFPHLKNLKDIWDYSIKVSKEVSKHFPPPMKLEFEDNIYHRYLILSKKRYLYFTTTLDGVVSNKLDNKGVLLKRRDNSKIIRMIYEKLIRLIIDRTDEFIVLEKLLELIRILYTIQAEVEDFQISKSVKEIQTFIKKIKNEKKLQYGDYLVPRLKEDENERNAQLQKKNVTDEEEFYQANLPGAVQLALRMRSRGQHIESGSRLSYIITKRVSTTNVSDRMEEVGYFKSNYSKHMIDVTHYLKLLTKPIEEILLIVYEEKRYKNFIKDIYKYHLIYDNVVDELFLLFNNIQYDKEILSYKKPKKPRKPKITQTTTLDTLWRDKK